MTTSTLNVAINAKKALIGATQFVGATKKMGSAAVAAGTSIKGMIGVFAAFTAIKRATDTIAAFETEMATLQNVTNATADAMAEMSDKARELGKTTKFSAAEAGQGLVFLARAGFNANEAMEAIRPAMNLAQSGMMSMGAAADLASNVLGQFNLSAEETTRVVDTLLRTSNQANTDVTQLGEALKMAGPVAGALGLEVEETAEAIGILGDKGIQASMAGTNLRMILLSLINPTDKAKSAIKEMGLSMADLNPQTQSLSDLFTKLGDAQLTVSQAARIFQARNAGAAVIFARNARLLRDRIKGEKDMTSASDASARMANTLANKIKALNSVVEEAFIKTGDGGLTGGLKNVVEGMTNLVKWTTATNAEFEKMEKWEQALVTLLSPTRQMSTAWESTAKSMDKAVRAMADMSAQGSSPIMQTLMDATGMTASVHRVQRGAMLSAGQAAARAARDAKLRALENEPFVGPPAPTDPNAPPDIGRVTPGPLVPRRGTTDTSSARAKALKDIQDAEAIKEKTKALMDQVEAEDQAKASLDELMKGYEFEATLIGKSNAARQIAVARHEALTLARQAGLTVLDKEADRIEAIIRLEQKRAKEQHDAAEQAVRSSAAQEAGLMAVVDALGKIGQSSKSSAEALRGLVIQLAKVYVQSQGRGGSGGGGLGDGSNDPSSGFDFGSFIGSLFGASGDGVGANAQQSSQDAGGSGQVSLFDPGPGSGT